MTRHLILAGKFRASRMGLARAPLEPPSAGFSDALASISLPIRSDPLVRIRSELSDMDLENLDLGQIQVNPCNQNFN